MSKTELMPCPFCGGTHIRAQWMSFACYCECIDCYARGGVVKPHGLKHQDEDKVKAIEAWNTRAERSCHDVTQGERTQAFTCSECGCWVAYDEHWETGIYIDRENKLVHIHPAYCPNCGAKVVEQ